MNSLSNFFLHYLDSNDTNSHESIQTIGYVRTSMEFKPLHATTNDFHYR